MKKSIIVLLTLIISCATVAQTKKLLTDSMALELSKMPLLCIDQEYPNKPGHTYSSADEVNLSPKDLHPSFFGCFDWHSSVHGHWMLLRVFRHSSNLKNKEEILHTLADSFRKEKLLVEADYFSKYEHANIFERTYGWAWVLKLDEELQRSTLSEAEQWHKNMKPLTDTIVKLWKAYLPKQTYPNRTGVHPNSAFALGFAIDWARQVGDTAFEKALVAKAIDFYENEKDTPAYLEPNGSDFFSPSLEIAELMSRIYEPEQFQVWFQDFLNDKGLQNVSEIPIVSDLSDYQTVHLVGLSFSRAWCMQNIAKKLPEGNPRKNYLKQTAQKLIENGLPQLFQGNYGGGHWLASFAMLSLVDE
ncbi:hypothetical protein C7377_0315 [Balneicella halophila]|uniref:DUF2891 family protein n=1 Tax=Balneicella halophila TaxID=1537566 RepID=A0A7L4UQJ1_BALHA|nr:DUF2891 domain-containing protein [Balneicella halophila]PVX52020.1 hypothetical protein C7377_0315 [Balneicella halophila]